MQGEGISGSDGQITKRNRPHCFYLWFLRGEAVCSEKHLHRSCAYPSWECPAKNKSEIRAYEANSTKTAPSDLSYNGLQDEIHVI